MKQVFSKFLSLNSADFIKGAVVAVLGAVLGLISATIEERSLNFDWPAIGKAALLAVLAYLTKNIFTNSSGEFAKTEK